jgi:hypothetical protein
MQKRIKETEVVTDGRLICCFIKGTHIIHREDGPAIEWQDGTKEWFLYGESLTKIQWLDKRKEFLKNFSLTSPNQPL